MLNVAYHPTQPEQPFDLDAVIDQTTKIFGYGTFWYWKLFTGPDGAKVLDTHRESLWDAAHGEPETWLETLCREDGLRNFVTRDKRQLVQAYATPERREAWLRSMAAGGFDAPLNYYRAMAFGVQNQAERDIDPKNIAVNVPFFFFGGKRDLVCKPELLRARVDAGLVPDYRTVIVDSGHWAHLALPDVFGEALIAWLKEKF